MSRSIYNSPNHENHLNTENSLPTYEEATGKVHQTVPASVAVQPTTVINNVNGHVHSNDDPTPIHQPYTSSYYCRPYINTSPRNISDVEAGLQQPARNLAQHEDPVVRQMAQTVLAECERARRKRESRKVAQCIGLVFGVIFGIILFAAHSSRSHYHRYNG